MGIVNFKYKNGAVYQLPLDKPIQNGDLRIGVCHHTKKEIVQKFTGELDSDDEGWICLHNTIPEDDIVDVANFKKKYNL